MSKTISKTRKAMEIAASFIARHDALGMGIDSKEMRKATYHILNWKKWFCHYLQNQPLNEKGAALLNTQPTTGPMGLEKSKQLADAIFKIFYDGEIRAYQTPTHGQFCERDHVGPVEFGDLSMKDEESRQDVWANYKDEVVQNNTTLGVAKFWTPDSRKKENYSELLSLLARHPEKKGQLLLNASKMCKQKMISKEQLDDLCSVANNITREMVVRSRLGVSKEPDVKFVQVISDEGISYI